MSDAISKAAAALGKRGGKAGTGKAKKRSAEHYSAAGKKSGEVRRAKAKRLAELGVGKVSPPQWIKDAQRKSRARLKYQMRRYGLTEEQAKKKLYEDKEDDGSGQEA